MVLLRIIAVSLLIASAAAGQEAKGTPDTIAPAILADTIQRLPPVVSEEPPPAEKKNNSSPPGMFGQRSAPLSYRTTWFPTVPVSGQNANFSMLDQNLSVVAPLGMMPSPQDSPLARPAGGWLLSAGVRNRSIQTEALLPDTGQPYPEELWNVNMGLMYFSKLDNDWSWGGGMNFGSASDHPFASIQEMFVGMHAFLRIPSGEHNAWLFSLMYTPMGELRFPIPGVAYYYAPSENFHMNIGLPFSIWYRPLDRLTLEASYLPIHTIHAKAK